MPFRPEPSFRRNVNGVIIPLTEAIRRKYGARESDGAYPLGAFYPTNVSKRTWRHAGGIWYVPVSEADLEARRFNEAVVAAFMRCIDSGEACTLPSRKVVSWEEIPPAEARGLPRREDQ
ncbi:MAG: hypothetical protein JJU22_04950 [Gammaproteobacteria bacterium]|nr:hypothetical protein [Gammaproteobacteria bacterium]